MRNKDTHNIKSTNADLRNYLAGLARRSRTFYRIKETLEAVLSIFINSYNRYGEYKAKLYSCKSYVAKSFKKLS